MTSILSKLFIFAAGGVIGSVVTWKLLKTKYEKIAQEEIDSVKAVYSRHQSTDSTEECTEEIDEFDDEQEQTEYVNIVKEYAGEGVKFMAVPRVIAPDEFGSEDDYETINLTYYADGVLTDEDDIPIEDVDGMIGEDSLTHFGEYEDDSVHVRNDKLKCDYEILYDTRNYSDVVGDPKPM